MVQPPGSTTHVDDTWVDTSTWSSWAGLPTLMRKVDQEPSSPMLRANITSVADHVFVLHYIVDIQIPAWINHDRRSLDRHYELLFLGEG